MGKRTQARLCSQQRQRANPLYLLVAPACLPASAGRSSRGDKAKLAASGPALAQQAAAAAALPAPTKKSTPPKEGYLSPPS